MSTLKSLQDAISHLERQKTDLLTVIQENGWPDEPADQPIPARERNLIEELTAERLTPELRPLPSHVRGLYQRWYSAARVILDKNQPGRLDEFDDAYSLAILRVGQRYTTEKHQRNLQNLINLQFDILAAVPDHLKFSVYDIELTAYSVLMDDEVEAARHLLSKGFLRSAGALVGVVLERHLKILLTRHTPPVKYPSKAGLSRLNDLCKETIYDLVTWRKVQHLTDLRNLCDHDRKRDPTKDEVDELIDGVSAILRTCNPLSGTAQT